MAQRNKKPISPIERRRWLEQLETGTGITQISKVSGRDIRVVKHHIEVAREERAIAQARGNFLLSRMEKHQEDLLAEVRRLRDVIQYPPCPLEPYDHLKQKLLQALKEHSRRHPLQRLLDLYVRAVGEYEATVVDVRNKLAETEVRLAQALPQGIAYPWSPNLVDILRREALPEPLRGRSYLEGKDNDVACSPSWGEFSLTRSSVPEASLSTIFEAHKKLVSYAEEFVQVFQDHRQHLEELVNLIRDELDGHLLKRLVPGRCRYCPV